MTEREQGRYDALQEVHAFVSEQATKADNAGHCCGADSFLIVIDYLDDKILEAKGMAPTDPKMEKA